jgi:hypothetical protein
LHLALCFGAPEPLAALLLLALLLLRLQHMEQAVHMSGCQARHSEHIQQIKKCKISTTNLCLMLLMYALCCTSHEAGYQQADQAGCQTV